MRRESVINLENVSVCYRVPNQRVVSFKGYVLQRLMGRIRYHAVWALQDVTLAISRGEIVGIIGPNGAGKSTLLKVIARVIHPTQGRVRVWGRVAPLIELGAGFHAELTGRENIYLNAAILGHSRRETDRRFQDIVDFAELWDFIDAPLRTYSTGMIARLGFAVATAWVPDILIVDEVLAVGDEVFQQKCRTRMDEFRHHGTTILMVSHDMPTVETFCHRAVWLDHGHIQAIGPAREVTAAYRQEMGRRSGQDVAPPRPLVSRP
ncbi:MAG: ABC transporter ATP-binding protein [Acidobacteria bacterium]|nr:ABC transporter ATP-binding protein [Acidobacteriota bacterium]MDW7984627.1 ABC transporter ATP-binding protein [Acidobacteriota bacterium]